MQWDYRQIRKTAWGTTFHRGWQAWFALVVVCFVFSFIGARNASQTSFIDGLDRVLGTSDALQPHNDQVLMTYFDSVPWVKDMAAKAPETTADLINGLTENYSWIINILALNPRYFANNPQEVLGTILLIALMSFAHRFCVLNVMTLGQHRYVMESRFSRKVTWRRMLAPFHLSTLRHVIWVMMCYHFTLLLWGFTIVGGIYKAYQYGMVPYLLAENPALGWREAKRLSRQMTQGHKGKIFLTQLSYLPVMLLGAIPVIGLLVSVPLVEELNAELYFVLRNNPAFARDEALFVERAFDGSAYVRLSEQQQADADARQPVYLLQDINMQARRQQHGPLPYKLVDLVYIFMIFCFIGWVWEVGLHFFQAHEFVNRGSLYGPWIPIYGVGGASMVILLDRFRDHPVKLFLIAINLSALLEYATSFVLDFMFNTSYWSYNDMMFNVNGRICLAGLVAFGIGGMLAIYIVAPAISRSVDRMPPRLRYTGAAVLAVAFCTDIAYGIFKGFNKGAGVGEDL